MNRWPRTAGRQRQPTDGASTFSTQPAASDPSSATDSPRAVLGGVPHPGRPAKAAWAPERGAAAAEGRRRLQSRPEGHAQDVLHLLDASWFGPLIRSATPDKGAEQEDWGPPAPAPRGRRQQRDERGGGARGADASPPTSGSTASQQSSQRSATSGAQVPPRLPAPTPAQAILSRRDAAAAVAVQDLPGIGTWAGRYRLFGRRQEEEQQQQGQQQGAAPAAAAAAAAQAGDGGAGSAEASPRRASGGGSTPIVLRPGGIGAPGGSPPPPRARPAYGSQEAQEEAWRWRFSRKWATEQARFHEEAGGAPSSLVSDDLDALAFTQACGVGVNLQVQPTSTPRRVRSFASAAEEAALGAEGSASALLCQFDGADASYMSGGVLGADMSPGNSAHGGRGAAAALQRTGSGAGTPGISRRGSAGGGRGRGGGWLASGPAASPRGPSATSGVLAMANKARDLLQKQGAIEAEVQDRWERTRSAGASWVGASLAPVKIDMHGRFKYCVLRISDSAGHTRFLVRGHARATPDALLDSTKAEAAAASRADGLPAAYVEVVGGGVMEWREDTERELLLQPSALVGAALQQQRAASDSPTKAPYLSDVSGLTASLVRQALPCHFRITTGAGAGASRASLASNNRI